MKCTSPVWVQDPVTAGVMYVPCGRCMACRISRARMWSLRIMHETRDHKDSCFVTLTYNDESLPRKGSLVKEHCQLFFKRLRKALGRPVRYFLGGEYGDIGRRPHYHVVLFGCSAHDRAALEKAWPWGFVHIGNVTYDSACYVASYTLKKLSGARKAEYALRGVIPEFSLMSRRPGIGALYCSRNATFLKDNVCCVKDGHKVPLPRYYRDRLFSDEDKSIIHQMAQELYDERFKKAKEAARVKEGFEVLEYQRGQRAQHAADLKAREGLKRRKL